MSDKAKTSTSFYNYTLYILKLGIWVKDMTLICISNKNLEIEGNRVWWCRVRLCAAMKGGRKNLKRATEAQHVSLQEGQSIMQVVSLRGTNLIEVMDARGEKSLALFPAKFQKSMWIKRGSFVVADESGKEKALESGSKVACIVSQVLFYEQVRALEKSPEWPAIFNSTSVDDSKANLHANTSQQENEIDSSDDDGLPPLQANINRMKPIELQSDAESDSSSDADS
ncbi:Nucleic acid-binding, OB-fold [Quillaja saponaria]|uniref:Nucleic acid-binding, OB-fold n=1 Tax=Quillaja saponaria TaxID=32244 RepID=A0AAD7PL18_QUISA|nr:Nucleic acid-binding, OB-fold [Quillaja saponaria]